MNQLDINKEPSKGGSDIDFSKKIKLMCVRGNSASFECCSEVVVRVPAGVKDKTATACANRRPNVCEFYIFILYTYTRIRHEYVCC